MKVPSTRSDTAIGHWLFYVACFVYVVGVLAFTIDRVQDAVYFTVASIALLVFKREFLR